VNRTISTRLRKLEAISPSRKQRLFVIDGDTPAERDADIERLIASGAARPTDLFIYTGVPRPHPEFGNWNGSRG
jgi:molybdopterin-guanine dinucleotide biosynthesis protein A